MIKRLRFRLCSLSLVTLLAGLSAVDAGAAGQDAPVLGGEPVLPDITWVRGAIRPVGADDSVRVALDVHLRGVTTDSVFFPTAGLHLDSVQVDGRASPTLWRSGRTAVPVPPDSSEIRVTLFYVVRSGLNRRSDGAGPFAIWTSAGGVDAHWLPLPAASDDLFHADLTFSLPDDWTLVQPRVPETAAGDSLDALDAPGVHLLRPTEAVTAHDLGFAVVRTSALRISAGEPDESNPTLAAVGPGILDRPADSVRADLGRVRDFLSDTLALSIRGDTPIHLLLGGSPGGMIGTGVAVHGDAFPSPDEPWKADFIRSESVVAAIIGPSLTRIPITDIWLREAIVAWLSSLHVRSIYGEAAHADVMEDLASDYMNETAARPRPLVWDRWTNPVDLLDAQARGRGAWILHMIEAMIDRDALLSGLDAFLDLPDDALRDSEAFRESIEAYSNADLSRFFDAWVYGAGHPVLSVSTSHDAAGERLTVRIEQSQDGPFVPTVFPMSPGVRFASIEGVSEERIRIDEPIATVSLGASIAPTYLHLDTGAEWLFEYRQLPPADDIVSTLRDDDNVASRVRTYRTLSKGNADSGLLFGARRVIEEETDPVAKTIGLGLPVAMAPAPSAERMLLEHASDPSAVVRAGAIRGLGAFESPAVGDAALRAANSDSNPYVLAAAVPVLIARRPSIAWDVVESALVTASPAHRVRIAALRRVGDVDRPDGDRLSTLLEHTGAGQPFAIRRTAALESARVFPGHARVESLVRRWLAADEALLRLTALDMLGFLSAETTSEILIDFAGPDAEPDPDPLIRSRLHRPRPVSESG